MLASALEPVGHRVFGSKLLKIPRLRPRVSSFSIEEIRLWRSAHSGRRWLKLIVFSRSLIKNAFKLFVFLAALFGLFLLVSFLAFYHLLSVGEFRRFLIDEIEQNTKFKVQLGEARLEVGRILGVGFHDPALSKPAAVASLIPAERITARV